MQPEPSTIKIKNTSKPVINSQLIQNLIKSIKFNKKILISDFISFGSGLIGVILGFLSIFALMSFWNDEKASIILTAIAIIFDFISFSSALIAFIFLKKFLNANHHKIPYDKKIHQLDKLILSFDFLSFCLGFIGTVCEIISLIVLLPQWHDSLFSYNITIVAVCFDVLSTSLALFAGIMTIKVIKNYSLLIKN